MSDASPRANFLRRHYKLLLASALLALGLVWVLRRGALPLLPPPGTLERVSWPAVALAVLALLASMMLRFARYTFLISSIAQISMRRIMAISCIAVGLITFLPFRLGEFARPAMLREKGRLSAWAVTGTVGAERIIDGVVISVMLLAGLAWAAPHEPLPDHIGSLPVPAALVPWAARFATSFFAIAFLVMAIFYWFRGFARRLTERVIGLVSKSLAAFLADAVERVSDGLRFLTNLRQTLPFLATTVLSLAFHVWALQILAVAVGLPDVSFAQATVVTGVLGLAFALPNAPGFFGTIQLSLYAGLAVYVDPKQVVREGAAFVFIFYVSYLAMVIVVSLLGLLLESRTVDASPLSASTE